MPIDVRRVVEASDDRQLLYALVHVLERLAVLSLDRLGLALRHEPRLDLQTKGVALSMESHTMHQKLVCRVAPTWRGECVITQSRVQT